MRSLFILLTGFLSSLALGDVRCNRYYKELAQAGGNCYLGQACIDGYYCCVNYINMDQGTCIPNSEPCACESKRRLKAFQNFIVPFAHRELHAATTSCTKPGKMIGPGKECTIEDQCTDGQFCCVALQPSEGTLMKGICTSKTNECAKDGGALCVPRSVFFLRKY